LLSAYIERCEQCDDRYQPAKGHCTFLVAIRHGRAASGWRDGRITGPALPLLGQFEDNAMTKSHTRWPVIGTVGASRSTVPTGPGQQLAARAIRITTRASIGDEPRCLCHLSPLRDLARDVLIELFGRGAQRLETLRHQALVHVGSLGDGCDLALQPVDDA